jgi:hypothetical protein
MSKTHSRTHSTSKTHNRSHHGHSRHLSTPKVNTAFDELSSMTKSKLGELLLTVAEDELIIEQQRQLLANLKEFEPYSAFTRIDRDNKGFITGRDLQAFIK